MWNEFVLNFSSVIGIISLCLIIAGAIFCVAEGIIPGFGVFGILGIVFEVCGVVMYAIQAFLNKTSALPVFMLILFVCTGVLLLFFIIVRSAKHGLLGKSSLVENKPAIPEDYGQIEMRYCEKLLNKQGKIVCECRPVGKAMINDEIYEVYAKNDFLDNGEEVKVVSVIGTKIIVDKIKSKGEKKWGIYY